MTTRCGLVAGGAGDPGFDQGTTDAGRDGDPVAGRVTAQGREEFEE